MDREERRRARQHISPSLDDASLAPLLPPLVDGLSSQDLAAFATELGKRTDFRVAEFDEPLGDAARDGESLDMLRNSVAKEFTGHNADRFLLSTLRVDSSDIAWVCQIEPDRGRPLLLRLLAGASDRSLLAVQRQPATRDRILDVLSGDLTASANQITRILKIGGIPIDQFLDLGCRVLPHLNPSESKDLAEELLARALSEAELDDPRVALLLDEVGSQIDTHQLVRMATAESAPAMRVGENIVLFDAAAPRLRQQAIAHIDELSEHLAQRGRTNFGQAAYEAWARLLASAKDPAVKFRAASPTLTYALDQRKFPVSALIVVSFPVVYQQLLLSKEDDRFNIPAFFALPMSFFVDWDRARSARQELVDTFLKSSWPPADLLVTAIDAKIDQFVFEYLTRTSSGRVYIQRMEMDISRLQPSKRHLAHASLQQFAASIRHYR